MMSIDMWSDIAEFWNGLKTETKKEIREEMKKRVSFDISDGSAPTRNEKSHAFNFRTPIALTLPPGVEMTLKLGLKCDRPVLLIEPEHLFKKGLVFKDKTYVTFDAGLELAVWLRNASSETVLLERGDTVARGVVLDNSDVVVDD